MDTGIGDSSSDIANTPGGIGSIDVKTSTGDINLKLA
jgi:hypothetical protein